MKPVECPREQDVLDALASGRWPDELRGHVASCAICADVETVALALQEDHADAWADARVPPSGAVWWRLELRARTEAARAAARPIAVIQTIAAACAAVALLAFAGFVSPWVRERLLSLAGVGWSLEMPAIDVAAIADMVARAWVPLALAAAVWLVLVPVALYFTFSEE